MTRAAAERFIQSIVDLALDVNGHITAAQLEVAPASGRSSFELMAEAGVLDAALADAMAPSVSLRNFLVHRYAAIDVEKVAEGIEPILEQYQEYVRRVAAFVAEAMDDREP